MVDSNFRRGNSRQQCSKSIFVKAVVANDWPAVLFAKNLVFTSDGIETGRKTTLASFRRVHLGKHRKLHAEIGRCIPASPMAILSHFPDHHQPSQRVADDRPFVWAI